MKLTRFDLKVIIIGVPLENRSDDLKPSRSRVEMTLIRSATLSRDDYERDK